jgi:hypothetical protein
MSQLIAMILRADDLVNPEVMTEVWRQPMPAIQLDGVEASHYLDGMEATVMEVGWAAMRTLLVEQWRLMDQVLVEHYRQEHPGVVTGDGHDALKVVSRLGVVHLPRQVCYFQGETAQHTLPGNAALPEHEGQVTTRGVQEWVCLLPQDMPFGTAERLLGWMTHDPEVMSETQVRRWVCAHGQIIRAAEQAEVEALLQRPDLSGLQAQLAPVHEPRCPAAWPVELNHVVETALAQPEPQPPDGVTLGDWERVMQARRAEPTATAADLRRLGPEVQPGQIIASTDDVQVRRPEKRRWLDLRTAYVRTAHGYRYLSGTAEMVLNQLYLLLVLCGGGRTAKLTLLGDGARWIAKFFTERLAAWPSAELVLDWYHCRKKCYDLTSLICRGRVAKAKLLGALLLRLWRGQVDDAITLLDAYRPQAKDTESLDKLITYLSDRRAYLPNYKERRAQRQYIGSAHTEKANDLIVARRQKHQGMHWSEATSDALAALRTLLLNGGWDLYWQKRQVLPLAVPIGP